jgi:hypothetical protein
VLSLVVPPEPPPIEPLGGGSYAAPAMWDDDEWASPTPCCREWVLRRIAELEVEGRLDLDCPTCGKAWTAIWDPWKPNGRGHTVWIE